MNAIRALEILDLASDATSLEIKRAYRDLAKVWHPDRFMSDLALRQKAEDTLKRINEAYQTLQGRSDRGGDGGRATQGSQTNGAAKAQPSPSANRTYRTEAERARQAQDVTESGAAPPSTRPAQVRQSSRAKQSVGRVVMAGLGIFLCLAGLGGWSKENVRDEGNGLVVGSIGGILLYAVYLSFNGKEKPNG